MERFKQSEQSTRMGDTIKSISQVSLQPQNKNTNNRDHPRRYTSRLPLSSSLYASSSSSSAKSLSSRRVVTSPSALTSSPSRIASTTSSSSAPPGPSLAERLLGHAAYFESNDPLKRTISKKAQFPAPEIVPHTGESILEIITEEDIIDQLDTMEAQFGHDRDVPPKQQHHYVYKIPTLKHPGPPPTGPLPSLPRHAKLDRTSKKSIFRSHSSAHSGTMPPIPSPSQPTKLSPWHLTQALAESPTHPNPNGPVLYFEPLAPQPLFSPNKESNPSAREIEFSPPPAFALPTPPPTAPTAPPTPPTPPAPSSSPTPPTPILRSTLSPTELPRRGHGKTRVILEADDPNPPLDVRAPVDTSSGQHAGYEAPMDYAAWELGPISIEEETPVATPALRKKKSFWIREKESREEGTTSSDVWPSTSACASASSLTYTLQKRKSFWGGGTKGLLKFKRGGTGKGKEVEEGRRAELLRGGGAGMMVSKEGTAREEPDREGTNEFGEEEREAESLFRWASVLRQDRRDEEGISGESVREGAGIDEGAAIEKTQVFRNEAIAVKRYDRYGQEILE